jgi:adenine-specific DNA-methyltransferase
MVSFKKGAEMPELNIESGDTAVAPKGLKSAIEFNANYALKDPNHDEIKDGYGLNWVGKNYAKLVSSLATETVVIPDVEHNAEGLNVDSQNVFLTGDNLDVLKHLQNAYTGKVDMIYIDPPYNTGSDGFVYSDNFKFTDVQLKNTLGLADSEVQKVKNIEGKASHSAWLTFMYPRLFIAKRLLKVTGVIFISIDDNEQANLKLLCDEVFGEGNFVGNISWESKTKSQNTKTAYNKLQLKVEHIFVYTRKDGNRFNLVNRGQKEYPLTDQHGKYREHILEVMNATGVRGRESMVFEIKGIMPPNGKQWKLGRDQVATYESSGNLFVRDEKIVIKIRPEEERTERTEPFWGIFIKRNWNSRKCQKGIN